MGSSSEFQAWARRKAAELATGKSIEQQVDEELQAQNLKVEIWTANGWEII